MKSILLHIFLAVAFAFGTNALVPTNFITPAKSLAIAPWKPQSTPTSQFSHRQPYAFPLFATAVDADSLIEKQETKPPILPPNDELDLSSRVINFVFLALAFGYAAYTIFNIDNGLTRGWTTGEIAMRIPLDNWGAYESYLANKPIFTKTLINVIIYLLGDWLSQTAFQGKNVLDFDISRTLRNGFIGLCFGPLVHEYYQFSDTILPPENGIVTRLEKIFMDQTLYLTVKCSIYISAVGLLGGDDWPTVKQNVQDKIGGVILTAWKFWPLVHCITYGLVPARHRILWVNSVDLVWNAILASQAQKTDESEEGLVQGDADSLVLEAAAIEVPDDASATALRTSLKGVSDHDEPALIVVESSHLEAEDAVVVEVIDDTLTGTNTTEELLVSK